MRGPNISISIELKIGLFDAMMKITQTLCRIKQNGNKFRATRTRTRSLTLGSDSLKKHFEGIGTFDTYQFNMESNSFEKKIEIIWLFTDYGLLYSFLVFSIVNHEFFHSNVYKWTVGLGLRITKSAKLMFVHISLVRR